MILRYGDMWQVFAEADLFLITTNAVTKKNGALVMGSGIAQQARDRFPGLDLALGRAVHARTGPVPIRQRRYCVLVSPRWPEAKLAAFQVKYHYRDLADYGLIHHSTQALRAIAERDPALQCHLNYPGIGHGHLDPAVVHDIIRHLPDNVHVWQHP